MKKDLKSILRIAALCSTPNLNKKVYSMTISGVKVYMYNTRYRTCWNKGLQRKMWKDLTVRIENLPIPEDRKLEHKKHIQKKLDYINQKPKPH